MSTRHFTTSSARPVQAFRTPKASLHGYVPPIKSGIERVQDALKYNRQPISSIGIKTQTGLRHSMVMNSLEQLEDEGKIKKAFSMTLNKDKGLQRDFWVAVREADKPLSPAPAPAAA